MNATQDQTAQPTVSQESLLLNYVQRLERHREGRRGIHIHLSKLRDHNRRTHHLRVAGNTFEGLVQQFDGQMFSLSNGDLIFVCKGANVEDMDDAVMRIRYLFDDDPLAMTDVADNFSTWYNIEAQYGEFLALAERMHEVEQVRRQRIKERAAQWGESEASRSKAAITPTQLGKLEDFLQRADLSGFIRRQQCCALSAEMQPRPIFKELYISVDELAATVLPGVNLAANKWLFQHLTRTLDRRVLKILARAEDSDLHSSFSINMNVATLLSPGFLEFDSQLRMGGRGTIVIEMQLIDVFSDLQEFMFTRDFLREKGYRICLDGIAPVSLSLVDRQTLGADLIKLAWSETLAAEDGSRIEEFKTLIDRSGESRVILYRCDSAEAIRFGQSTGITMYQGRYLDAALQEQARFGKTNALKV